MTNLNLANNSLGMPNGWSGPNNDGEYRDPNGEYHKALPAGSSVLGVIAIANAIPDMGALAMFDISENDLSAGGCKAIVGALKGNSTLTELNVAETYMTYGSDWGDMSAVIALADAIPDMGALTSLNLSLNNLDAYDASGAMIVAEAIKVTHYAIAVVLAPFSCPSDHWFNCCCLPLSTGQRGDDAFGYQWERHQGYRVQGTGRGLDRKPSDGRAQCGPQSTEQRS
jgi:hypothetical protein